MKKYKIRFSDDYLMYEEWANDDTCDTQEYWKAEIEKEPDKLEMCRKWTGKEITLLELESLISELGEVIFNGESITIINGYLD